MEEGKASMTSRTSRASRTDYFSMANFRRPEELLCCSFCGKSQNDVKKLIAGPGVYVCNECIDICNEIINDDERAETSSTRTTLPKPQEISGFLDEYVIGQDE